jgi:hypothetical protein
MLKALARNKVMPFAALVVAIYFLIRIIFGLDNSVILLNGLFVGSVIAVGVTYSNILLNTVVGEGPYDRVRQMALGIALAWLAIIVGVTGSVVSKSNGSYVMLNEYTPLSRYLAIVAAVVQVSAPDLGSGIFFGRDRRLLYVGVLTGAIVAIVIILLQS